MDASNRGLTTFGLSVTGGAVTLGIKRKVKSRCYFSASRYFRGDRYFRYSTANGYYNLG